MFKQTTNSIQSIVQKVWGFLMWVLGLVWKIVVPVALVGLLIAPIFLTFVQPPKKSNTIAKASQVTKGEVSKRVKVSSTIEYEYDYDLPVYQDAELKEILVKAGDKVKAGDTLANLDFVVDNKLRTTATENQIKTFQTELANNNEALGNTNAVNQATQNQLSTSLSNKYKDYDALLKKINDKTKENNDKKDRYTKEQNDYQIKLDTLDSNKGITDSIKQYQDKIDVLRRQRDGQSGANAPLATQAQVNSQQQQVDALSKQYTTQCPNGQPALVPAPTTNTGSSAGNSAPIDCGTLYAQFKTAQDNLSLTRSQLSNTTTQTNFNSSDLYSQISDLQSKIDTLKSVSNYSTTNPNLPVADSVQASRLETIKGEYRSEINARKADIKILDNSQEVKNLQEQLETLERTIREVEATQNVTKRNLDQSLASINQRNNTASVSLENAKRTLLDTKEDVAKQEKNKSITAKKDGIVGKVYKEQGLVASGRESVFKVVSDNYRLKFNVSADTRSQILKGMKVITTNKYQILDSIVVTEVNLVPNVLVGTSTAIEYTIYATLPKSADFNYTQGESIDVEVIIKDVKDVVSIPSTAVFNNQVYIGTGPKEQQVQAGAINSPISIGRNGTPRINTGNQNQRGGNNAPKSYKFDDFIIADVVTGLDDGKYVEIKNGLTEKDFIFTIFPRTDDDKKAIQQDNKNNK
jgi:multidrug efflux pump subunit AcrA (membrane-fusion protein)